MRSCPSWRCCDLALLARGELVASGRTFHGTFYGIGGLYGSLLLDAQRSHDGRITDMGDTISAVDAGWLLGAGIELFSLATVKPAIELRYRRGLRNLLPASLGEVNQQTVSCLVSITYGGASPAAPPASIPDVLHGSHDHGATRPPSPPGRRVTSVVVGRPGDRWLDTVRSTRIERATRDGTYGYEVTCDIAGHGQVVMFWPRERIDFDDRGRDSRLQAMTLRQGRLRYPLRITSKSLPEVHRGILQLEAAYARQADGAIRAMEGFVIVSSLGGLQPTLRTVPKPPPRSAAPRDASNAVRPSSTGAAARGVRGQWVQTSESMSARAAAYQARFGRAGQAFKVNDVKSDGFANGVLLEVKGPGYATFVRNGKFQDWFRGADALVSQARHQVKAAGGAPIQWHFAEEAAADATRALLTSPRGTAKRDREPRPCDRLSPSMPQPLQASSESIAETSADSQFPSWASASRHGMGRTLPFR